MKIIMIECTAEELRANRTVMDSITEALSGFTRRLAGVDLDNEQVEEVLGKMNEEEGEIEDEFRREEAIKMLKSKMDGHTDTSYEWAETVRMAIKALEQEPCEDCVKREDIIKHICESKECYKAMCKGRLYKRCFDIQWVYDLPSVTPKGVTITDFADKCRECGREKVLDKIRAEIENHCGLAKENH